MPAGGSWAPAGPVAWATMDTESPSDPVRQMCEISHRISHLASRDNSRTSHLVAILSHGARPSPGHLVTKKTISMFCNFMFFFTLKFESCDFLYLPLEIKPSGRREQNIGTYQNTEKHKEKYRKYNPMWLSCARLPKV